MSTYNSAYYLTKFSSSDIKDDYVYSRPNEISDIDNIKDFSILDRECWMKFNILQGEFGCAWVFSDSRLRNLIEFNNIDYISLDVLDKNKSDFYTIVYIDFS